MSLKDKFLLLLAHFWREFWQALVIVLVVLGICFLPLMLVFLTDCFWWLLLYIPSFPVLWAFRVVTAMWWD